MTRTARHVVVLVALALVAAACNGDDAAPTTSLTTTTVPGDTPTSTSSTSVPVTTSSTTTTTTLPAGEVLAVRDDTDDDKVASVQWLLTCAGYGDLTIDGEYGPATAEAVAAAQAALGRAVDGDRIDEETFAELSRVCLETRRLEADSGTIVVVENAAPGDPAEFAIALQKDDLLAATLVSGPGASITLHTDAGVLVPPNADGTWSVETTADHVIEVASDLEPVTFSMSVTVEEGVAALGQWILATNGITYDGTEMNIGDNAGEVLDNVFEFLGHGVRGAYDEFDTGWYVITDPQSIGIRGVFIENLAFLFFGPHPEDEDRPETLARIRYEGPSGDADDEPRPDNYVTTAEGITVGDTLADLQSAYGSDVDAGSNDAEYYYRYTDSRGELCFYFGAEEPDDTDTIVEIATECRG